MNCPKCGGDNPDTSKFCGHCGSRLPDIDPAADIKKTAAFDLGQLPFGGGGNPAPGGGGPTLMQTALQTAITAHPLTAALKEILAVHGGDMAWRRVRPPLVELDPDAAERLHRDLKALDFAPPPLQALAFDG